MEYESHNTHSFIEIEDGVECRSHNFPMIVGVGKTESESWEDMRRQLGYYLDNTPNALKLSIQNRKSLNRECLCGQGSPWPSDALAVRTGEGMIGLEQV